MIEIDRNKTAENPCSSKEKKAELLKLDENSLLQGVIMAEILGKPRAKRRKGRYEGTNSRR